MQNIRGLYGFRMNEEDKLTYKADDAEPEILGKSVMEFCADYSASDMRKMCENIYLCNPKRRPFKKEINDCFAAGFCPETKNKVSLKSWSYLFQNQNKQNLYAYTDYKHGQRPMMDRLYYIMDSNKIDYCYIINLDEEVLEFYIGHQKINQISNRYKSSELKRCAPCILKLCIPLDYINHNSVSAYIGKMRIYEKY